MAFVESWIETDPDGSIVTVSLMDDFARAAKRQIRERLEGDPANANSGIFESTGGGFASAAVPKAGSARTYMVTFANLGTLTLQDGRVAITSDTNRLYHLKGTGFVELAYAPIDGTRAFTGLVTFNAGLTVSAVTGKITVTSTTGTNEAYYQAVNTGGAYYFGVENSVGGKFGAAAYAGIISAPVGRVIQLVIAGTPYLTVAPTYVSSAVGLTVVTGGLTVSAGGLTVTTGGLTVSAGTTAVQALTATAGVFSGDVTLNNTTATSLKLNSTTNATADYTQLLFARGGTLKWRVGVNVTGGNADQFDITDGGGASAIRINNSTLAVTVAAGLSVMVGGAVISGGITAATGNIKLGTNAAYLRGQTSAAVEVDLMTLTADANNITRFIAGVDAGGFQWTNQAQSTGWATLSSGGLALANGLTVSAGVSTFGTTVTTSAASGEVVLANAKALRGVNAAGTNTYRLITLDANTFVQLADAGVGLYAAMPVVVAASLIAGSANANGVLAVDSTNNRFVYYSSGNRYYLTGTSF